MSYPKKCNSHNCLFDSPACPVLCKSMCKTIKPNSVSVTAQEAMNLPVRLPPVHLKKNGIPNTRMCTKDRIFGIPYDPRKDVDVPLPEEYLEQYLTENYNSMPDKVLKEYVEVMCCQAGCKCSMGCDVGCCQAGCSMGCDVVCCKCSMGPCCMCKIQ